MKRPLSVAETVELKLVASGERDKLKRLARERLEEAGWTEEVKQLCREFVAQRGTDVVTHAEIVSAVRSQARTKVPDSLKAELLRRIKGILEAPQA